MDISIITVTWNSEDKIAEQLRSVILGYKNLKYEQIVVDNASDDKTVKIVENNFLSVKLIKNKKNKGFSNANNQGVNISSGKFILFLNPDMRVEKGSLDKIITWMKKNKEVGIVSCKLVDKAGNFCKDASPRRFPKVWEQVLLILKVPHIFPKILDKYLIKDFDFTKEKEVDSVRGSFMLMRRELVDKLGWGFDPRYFIWFEDVDVCREAKKLGYKVMYTPIITCIDYVGSSFKKRETFWKQKQFTKSMFQYFKKWEPWYKWIWIVGFRPVGIFLAWIENKVSK